MPDAKLTIDNIGALKLADLVNPTIFQKVEELADDDLFDLEPQRAKELYVILEKMFLKYERDIKADPILYKRMGGLLLGLLWKSVEKVTPEVRKTILQSNVVFCIQGGVDIKKYLTKYLDIFETRFVPDDEERNAFINSLEMNREVLGKGTVTIKSAGAVPATLQNWIKDYNISSPVSPRLPDARRGKLEELNYLKTSSNVKILTPEEKKILETVLSIYDWLRFPIAQARVIGGPTAPTANKAPAPQPSQDFQLPTTKLNLTKPAPKASAPVKPTVPPKPVLPAKPTPPPPQQPKQGVTFKDLGPYVLGAEPQIPTPPKARAPVKQPPQLPVEPKAASPPPSMPAEPDEKSTPSAKYQGFSMDLLKDVEELSNLAPKPRNVIKPPKPVEPQEEKPLPQAAAPLAQQVKPEPKPVAKGAPVGTHELEDVLERARLKADASIPLAANDVALIVDLIKRKRENK